MFMDTWFKWMADWSDYCQDTAQRSILFTDIVRKRGNIYLEHLRKNQPPVLVFDYETILDGREFECPVNYSLVRILSRRDEGKADRRSSSKRAPQEQRRTAAERRHKTSIATEAPEAVSRPIIIFDPRAGHGPGIGGSKLDSQIGMAMDAGHPVYFLIFFPSPMPGQTLTDVRDAQIRFIEEVRRRHPKAPRPAIIGNCQGGWAAALVGAKRSDLVGPMVFNGSPLSYWAGVEGIHPLRYLGGLLGGVWITSLLSDIGAGIFDGAHLVANFESLNLANTLWSKQYHLWANIDTEEQRYLEFEKWWGGFFLMTAEEIHQIVDGLFIGNRLERGEFQLEDGSHVDLKNNTNPVVLFASFGDNITPPQQAFNWLVKTYGDVEEIKRRGQTIVYVVHSSIGHLGIFVSAKIARREHKSIIASFDLLYKLKPGLYEMRIEEDPDENGEYAFHYVEKTMADILAYDDGLEDEKAFLPVRQVSEATDLAYRTLVSPWIRMAITPAAAESIRQLHPLRLSRYFFSDLNPWMWPFQFWADQIRETRAQDKPADQDNIFVGWEKTMSKMIIDGLNTFRDIRDGWGELLFKTIYENPWMNLMSDFYTEADQDKKMAA
jgi:pimeloyl-ACP methyl ester carboxylesterase